MLRLLLGRDRIESVRTVFAVVAIVFAILASAELATQRTADDLRMREAVQAEAAAVGFAIALTTYDYAHPNVQSRALSAYTTPNVVAVVKRADADLVTARASSIGSVSADWVVRADGHEAEVVVATSQVARSRYALDSQRLAGRIDILLGRAGASWVVTSYAWLATPAPARAQAHASGP